jgi:SPP1 gp7 family putative phage head morphogenesis protein
MTWERALEADARRAAKNAVIIRAALRQSFEAERAYAGYLNTSPDLTLNLAQQRSRARAWAILNIRPNMEPLREALYRCWLEGYALGDLAAREAIRETKEAQKADVSGGVDWSKWKPGDAIAALTLKPPRAFQYLLEDAGITLKGFSDTTLTDIGNALGEAIKLGLSAKQAAKLINTHVANPARSLTIAITEQNRAISAATLSRYQIDGVQMVEWLVFDPCKICAENAGKVVRTNGHFPTGHQQPPAHPNCRCALAPVIPGMEEQMPGVGTTAVPPSIPTVATPIPDPTPVIEEVTVAARSTTFKPGKWTLQDKKQTREQIIDRIHALNPRFTREKIEEFVDSPRLNVTDRNVLKTGIIYLNGPVEVRFYASGAKIPEAKRKELLKLVEKLQLTNPKDKMVLNVGSTSTRKYGWAELGGEQMWITPKTVLQDTMEATAKEGTFKMPVLLSNPQRNYTLTHEWGHLIDTGRGWSHVETISRLKRAYPDAFKSEYSGKNTKEFYAEMFTEYYLSEGKTENPLVQAMAKEFGWKA